MFNNVLAIIADYGLLGGISIVLVIFVGFILYKFIVAKIDIWATKKKSNTTNMIKDNLKYHSFFTDAKYKLSIEIPNIEFNPNEPVRQRLFRTLIRLRVQTIMDKVTEFVGRDMDSWGADQWANEFNDMITNTITEFDRRAREEGVPDVVISKFNRWHLKILETVNDNVTKLVNSTIYNTNVARTNTLLFIMNLLLTTTISDAETTILSLNGEISGLEYKGGIIE